MSNLNYEKIVKEILYIFASILISIVGASLLILIYKVSGLYGAIFFSIMLFLASRLLYISIRNEDMRRQLPKDENPRNNHRHERDRINDGRNEEKPRFNNNEERPRFNNNEERPRFNNNEENRN